MKLLALELSSPVGSVAFQAADTDPFCRTFPADRQDAGPFFDNLGQVYEANGPPEMIVVGLGPGSYAGVRIAIATAAGLKIASGARLLGLPSVCAIDEEEYFFLGDARRSSFVFAHVMNGQCIEEPTLVTESEIHAKLRKQPRLPVIATATLAQFPNVTVKRPSALRLLQLAPGREGETTEGLEPIYLREPYITTPVA